MVLCSPRARRIRAQLLRSRDTYFLNEPVLQVEGATQTMGGLAMVAKTCHQAWRDLYLLVQGCDVCGLSWIAVFIYRDVSA